MYGPINGLQLVSLWVPRIIRSENCGKWRGCLILELQLYGDMSSRVVSVFPVLLGIGSLLIDESFLDLSGVSTSATKHSHARSGETVDGHSDFRASFDQPRPWPRPVIDWLRNKGLAVWPLARMTARHWKVLPSKMSGELVGGWCPFTQN